ncbi:hypothetical protein LINPERHAP1_LOCUS34695 [Linum perenne]
MEVGEDFTMCLVGSIVTDKGYNFAAFQERMAAIWRLGRGVEIEELGGKLLLFHFFHEVDLRNVMDGSPWNFDQSLLVLRELKQREHPMGVELRYADFWIQVHRLSPSFYSMAIGKGLGDYVGQLVA